MVIAYRRMKPYARKFPICKDIWSQTEVDFEHSIRPHRLAGYASEVMQKHCTLRDIPVGWLFIVAQGEYQSFYNDFDNLSRTSRRCCQDIGPLAQLEMTERRTSFGNNSDGRGWRPHSRRIAWGRLCHMIKFHHQSNP
jgi:hypothetical protein